MNRLLTLIAMTGAIFASAETSAADPINQSPTHKRQMMGCMTKRMSADKALSYNEATKACKAQLHKQIDNLASNTLGKPANAH
jgi:hypothetical protein